MVLDENDERSRTASPGGAGLRDATIDAIWFGDSAPHDRRLELTSRGVRPMSRGSNVRGLATSTPDVLVFPGLINSHDHLEFNCYPLLGTPPYQDAVDWADDVQTHHAGTVRAIASVPVSLRIEWGLIKNLMCGVTAVSSHGLYPPGTFTQSPIEVISQYDFIHSVHHHSGWRRRLLAPWRPNPVVVHVAEGVSHLAREAGHSLLR